MDIDVLVAVQCRTGRTPIVRTARTLSAVGEHAAGWLVLSGVGVLIDRRRRPEWIAGGVAALSAHAAAVVVKRVVRRPRPHDPRVRVLTPTPSQLSFPSAHSSSTTAWATAMAPVVGGNAALGISGLMALSRTVLGVHYPSDVVAGAVLGWATGRAARLLTRSAAL